MRRIVLVLALVSSALGVMQPALAQPSPHSICEGVLNQTAERGTAEENLLAKAAEKNAPVIQQLQSERAALQSQLQAAQQELSQLQTQINNLTSSIEAIEAELEQLAGEAQAALDANNQLLYHQLAAEYNALQADLQEYQDDLAQLTAQHDEVSDGIAQLDQDIQAIEAQLARGGC
jgi:chromosome segregation ATPase